MQQRNVNVPSLTIGGRVFTDLTNLKILQGVANGTTNVRCSLREAGASAGYQVPVGKTFKVLAVVFQVGASAAGTSNSVAFAYSDNDVGVAASTAFTNPVYIGGNLDNGAYMPLTALSNLTKTEFSVNFDIPAGKYLGIQALSTGAVVVRATVYGYEV
jgi:hypothetical protein